MSEESNSNEIPQSEEWPLEDLEWFKQQIPADLTGATGASEGSLDASADPLESISATDHESLGDTSLDPKPSTPTPQRVEHQTASDAGGTEPPGGLQSPSDSLRVTSTSGDDKNAAEAHLPAIQESSDASTQLGKQASAIECTSGGTASRYGAGVADKAAAGRRRDRPLPEVWRARRRRDRRVRFDGRSF